MTDTYAKKDIYIKDTDGLSQAIGKGYVKVGEENFNYRKLPEGYTQVEYIGINNGSLANYFDTHFTPNQDTKVVMSIDLQYNNPDVVTNAFFGTRTSTSSKAYGVHWNADTKKLNFFYNDGYVQADLDIKTFPYHVEIILDKNTLTFGDITLTRPYANFECDYTLLLGAFNLAGTADWFSREITYHCQIYDNGILVRDYVPSFAPVDGEMINGIYDCVNDTFEVSSGEAILGIYKGAAYHGPSRRIMKAYMKKNGVSVECGKSFNYVPWATGTDEQIAAMVAAADRGEINLSDYWTVGDTRRVLLSSMNGLNETESHDSQYVEFVLMHAGGYELATPTESGRTTCSFIVGMNNFLRYNTKTKNAEGRGAMDIDPPESSHLSWSTCDRRAWCNNEFRNAIPSPFRDIFKEFKCVGGVVATAFLPPIPVPSRTTTIDYFTFPAENEVIGPTEKVTRYAFETERAATFQYDWYKTASNRRKRYYENLKPDGSHTGSVYLHAWWLRSPYGHIGVYGRFCAHNHDGNKPTYYSATTAIGLSPVGCI